MNISFPIVPNRLFSGRTKNNRHFWYPETKITDFKILGTRLGTTLRNCRLVLETEMEPRTKSRFHYLCHRVIYILQVPTYLLALHDFRPHFITPHVPCKNNFYKHSIKLAEICFLLRPNNWSSNNLNTFNSKSKEGG